MKLKTTILTLGFMLTAILSGCDRIPKTDSAVKSDAERIIENNTVSITSEIENQISNFPKDVEILLIRNYREESNGYPKNVKNKNWMVLYKDSKTGNWMITEERPQIKYSFDECAAENTMDISSKYEGAVLFFSQFEGLSKTLNTAAENKNLVPDKPISFEMNGKTYSLLAKAKIFDYEGNSISSGQIEYDTEGIPDIPMMKSYKLSFETGNKSSQIAEIKSTHNVTPSLIWAGDLNGDGLPDMILNLSAGYEEEHLYFFLSDLADAKNQLKKAADLLVVFDC